MTYFPQSGTASIDYNSPRWVVRKKPVEVEAIRFNGGNSQQIIDWIGEANAVAGVRDGDGLNNVTAVFIGTLEGQMRADVGDWIIKGVKGEFYSCKPDIFEATYEPVREL
jgi:hypothetical protein